MKRYWRGTTKDDKFITEALGATWHEESTNLKSLELVLDDKDIVIKLPDNMEYVQAKTASADMTTGECETESRYIGVQLGSNTVIIRVQEDTGNISIELS